MKLKLSSGMYQTAMYGLGMVIMKSISLIMIPYVTRFLAPNEFGDLEVILTLINISSILFGFGLTDALLRFASQAHDAQEQNRYCSNIIGLAVAVSVALSIPLYVWATDIANALPAEVTATQIRLVTFALMLGNIIAVQLTWLRLKEKVEMFLWISVTRAALQAFFVALTLWMGYGVTGVVFASAISTFATFAILSIIQLPKTGLHFDWNLSVMLSRYSGPLVLSGIASFIIFGLQNWWLAEVIGTAEMAPYALALKFAMITAFILQPYMLWFKPKRFLLLKEAEGIQANARLASIGVTLGLLTALAIGSASIPAIYLLIPDSYHSAISFVPWLAFMWAIKNASDLMSLGCYTKDHGRDPMYINWSAALLAIVGFYYLIPLYGATGAMIAMYVVYSYRLVLFIYSSQRHLALPYPYLKLASMTILTVISLWLISLVDNLWLQIAAIIVMMIVNILFALGNKLLPKPQHLMKIKT